MTQPLSTEHMVKELYERQEVAEVMFAFRSGSRSARLGLYAQTLADPFHVDFFGLTGQPSTVTTPSVWAEFASACLQRLVVHHQYSNVAIEVGGDKASEIFYHVARHRFPNKHGDAQCTQYGW